MPRKAKKPIAVAVDEITAANAADLWRDACPRQPRLSPEQADIAAQILTELRGHRAWEYEQGRRYQAEAEAVRTLLRMPGAAQSDNTLTSTQRDAVQRLLRFTEPTPVKYPNRHAKHLPISWALCDRVRSVLTALIDGNRPRHDLAREALMELLALIDPHASWAPPWEVAAVACWLLAQQLGASPSRVATSQAVKFAAMATARLGFVGVTPRAVAVRLNALPH